MSQLCVDKHGVTSCLSVHLLPFPGCSCFTLLSVVDLDLWRGSSQAVRPVEYYIGNSQSQLISQPGQLEVGRWQRRSETTVMLEVSGQRVCSSVNKGVHSLCECVCMGMCVYMRVCMNVCHVHACMCTCVCMCVHVCAYMCLYM